MIDEYIEMRKMRKGIRPVEAVVLCAILATLIIPMCLANPSRLELTGMVDREVNQFDIYNIGDLKKGDTVKVVITDLRGNGKLRVYFGINPFLGDYVDFVFPREYTFTAPKDGFHHLWLYVEPNEKGFNVAYKGYVEW